MRTDTTRMKIADDEAPVRGRTEKRLPWTRMARLDVLGPGESDVPMEVEIVNCSARGVGVKTGRRRLAPDDRFSLSVSHSGRRVVLMYCVRHVSGETAGAELMGVIGLGFAERPEKVIMALMVGQFDEG